MSATARTAGILLIAVPLIFTAGFTGLQLTFDYPDILRQPAGEVLTRFAAAGIDLHLYWYAMMAAALLMTGAAIVAGLLLWPANPLLAAFSVGAGLLAALVQALGLLRWVMLVPALAAMYLAPGAEDAERAMAVALFDAANRYLGMGVGEHLGYFFTAAWTVFIAILILPGQRILGLSGLLIALGVLAGMLEPFGVPLTGAINAISYSFWALWTLLLGVVLFRRRSEQPAALPA